MTYAFSGASSEALFSFFHETCIDDMNSETDEVFLKCVTIDILEAVFRQNVMDQQPRCFHVRFFVR